jgi:hypothetical protein
MNANNITHEEILSLIEDFSPKIKKSICQTNYDNKEDLEQEIKIKIFEKINDLSLNTTPGFFQFIKNE